MARIPSAPPPIHSAPLRPGQVRPAPASGRSGCSSWLAWPLGLAILWSVFVPNSSTPVEQPSLPSTSSAVSGADRPSRPFPRTLRLTTPRMNGEDVRLVQNRLMDLAGIDRGSGGDGWYGPNTQRIVMAFQRGSGLSVTGVVDARTWNLMFSGQAQPFTLQR